MSEWMHATRVRRQQLTADCVFTREKCVHATFRRHQWHGSLSEPFNWMNGCKHLCESARCLDLLRRSQVTQHLDVKLSFWRYEGSLVQSQVCYKVKAAREDGLCFQKHIFLSSSSSLSVLPQLPFLFSSFSFGPFGFFLLKWDGSKLKQVLVSLQMFIYWLSSSWWNKATRTSHPLPSAEPLVCFLLLTVASRVYTGKFPKNFDKV